jgi:lipopolysaccharide export LptBFGC system permease protein LptF
MLQHMNASHRKTEVRGLGFPKGIVGSAVWRRVPIVDAFLFGHLWQAAREGAAMFAGLVFVFAIVADAREGGEPLNALVRLHILALQTPRVLSFTLPMALLYACIKAFSELSGRGELGALCAAGLGWSRILRAPLLLGALAGMGALTLQEWAVPRSEQARLFLLQSAAQSRARSGFQMAQSGSTGSSAGFQQIVNARSADFARAFLLAPVLKELRPDGSLRRQIVAARGHWDDRATVMVFESGWLLELPTFSTGTKDLKSKGLEFQNRPFERFEVQEFPPPERWSGVRTLRDMIRTGQFEALSLSELQMERNTTQRQVSLIMPHSSAQVSALNFAIHDRLAAPLVCLALVLIGCPLGVRIPRSPGLSALGRALVVLLVYFAVWLLASCFAKNGTFEPQLWAYLPPLLLLGAGLALLRGKEL